MRLSFLDSALKRAISSYSMSVIGMLRQSFRHTTRFDLCVAIVSFLSALVSSIKVHNE
jgi:hypothetical protein